MRVRQAVLVLCCAAQFMVVLDVSIVDVALPGMRHALHLSVTGQQWVVSAYTLCFAGFLMLGGRGADLFGRRRMFLLGLALFTTSSMLGGLAENGGWLIAARGAQGIGGAVLAPASLTVLTTTFTGPGERRRALGAWSATASSGAAVGVLAGGVLTSVLSWRWVLFVNFPLGAGLLAAAAVVLTDPASAARRRRRLDPFGAVTITAGLALLVYGIAGTSTHPWGSAQTVGVLSAGAGLLAAFGVIEVLVATDPLMPLGVFRRRSLSTANAVAFTIGTALFGLYFFQSLYLQQINGYSPFQCGMAFLPSGLATLGASLYEARLPSATGPHRLALGMLAAAGGTFWLTRLSPGDSYLAHVLGPQILFGLGLGLAFVPMTAAATEGMPVHQAGLASGLVNTSRQIGGAVGLAVMAAVASGTARRLGVAGDRVALTVGYDRALVIPAAALLVGAVLVLPLMKTRDGGLSLRQLTAGICPGNRNHAPSDPKELSRR